MYVELHTKLETFRSDMTRGAEILKPNSNPTCDTSERTRCILTIAILRTKHYVFFFLFVTLKNSMEGSKLFFNSLLNFTISMLILLNVSVKIFSNALRPKYRPMQLALHFSVINAHPEITIFNDTFQLSLITDALLIGQLLGFRGTSYNRTSRDQLYIIGVIWESWISWILQSISRKWCLRLRLYQISGKLCLSCQGTSSHWYNPRGSWREWTIRKSQDSINYR